MKLTVSFEDRSYEAVAAQVTSSTVIIPDVPGIRRYFVKRDWETLYYKGKVRDRAIQLGGAPCVFRTGKKINNTFFQSAKLTREWQFMWADLMAMIQYGKLLADLTGVQRAHIIQAFTGTTGSDVAFTNDNGTDRYNNYITGEMNGGKDPMIDSLISGGDTKCGVPEGSMVRMYSFLANETPPPVTRQLLLDPRVGWATIIKPDKTVTPFPRLTTSVPYPYITVEPYYYPLEELEEYPFAVPARSQYNPPRNYYP
jgi:hypothetical protein